MLPGKILTQRVRAETPRLRETLLAGVRELGRDGSDVCCRAVSSAGVHRSWKQGLGNAEGVYEGDGVGAYLATELIDLLADGL